MVFSLDFLYYNYLNATALNITWDFDPAINDPDVGYPAYPVLSANNCTMTITNGGLNISTNYTITVTATNNQFKSMTETVEFYFATGQPPYGGNVFITPDTGFVNSTLFTVGIFGWTSLNNTAMWRMWNTSTPDGYTFDTLLFPDYISASSNYTFLS